VKDIVYTHTEISSAVKSDAQSSRKLDGAPEGFRHLRINPQVIKVISDDGNLKLLAVFLRLKSVYSNSCIYNVTDSKLAAILKVSRQTANRLRNRLERLGWVKYHGGNLMLLKVTEISHEYIQKDVEGFSRKANVYLEVKSKQVKDIETYLRYLIIKQKEINKNYLLELRQDLSNPKSVKQFKKLSERCKKLGITALKGEIDYRLQISYKGLAKLLNCSVGSAYNYLRNLARKEVLKVYTKKEVLKSNVQEHIWNDFLSYQDVYKNCFYSYGYIIRNHCNLYNLLA
jgi:Mn-dependent DtxR family transcriptional regulator